jgi:hypothetical protein
MLYSDIVKRKAFSSYELAKETGISQPTAWLFHCKLQQAFASSGNNPLTGQVHIDEFVTGGPRKESQDALMVKRKRPFIMVEVRAGGNNRPCVLPQNCKL